MRANLGKFTMMDGVTLVAAFAIGICLATHFMWTDTASRFDRSGQPSAGWAVSCILWSGVIAGPLILSVQRFRGRCAALSWGEWVWLAPLPLYLLAYVSQGLGELSLGIVFLAIFAQCLVSFFALVLLVIGLFRARPDVACRWTDVLGCFVCMSVGPAIVYSVNQALSQL
jgi:hypothetical protein